MLNEDSTAMLSVDYYKFFDSFDPNFTKEMVIFMGFPPQLARAWCHLQMNAIRRIKFGSIFGEEFGFVGAVGLLLLYFAVIITGLSVAMSTKSHFGRLVSTGVVATFTLYVLINTGMVMGLAPVVGVPLPLVSYGGTVMLTIMAGFGFVMSAHIHRDQDMYRSSDL